MTCQNLNYLVILKIKDDGLDVISTGKGDNIRLIINYHPDYTKENVYNITEDVDDITKFAVISDTRFGSTNEQISILNDLYKNSKMKILNTLSLLETF